MELHARSHHKMWDLASRVLCTTQSITFEVAAGLMHFFMEHKSEHYGPSTRI